VDYVPRHGVKRLDCLRVLPELGAPLIEHVGQSFEEVISVLIGEVGVSHYRIRDHIAVLEHVPGHIQVD